MKINVTQEDIDNGTPQDACNCPVALAMRRVVGGYAHVGRHSIATDSTLYCIPDHVVDIIEQYDCRHTMEPFSFDAELVPLTTTP